MRNVRNNPNSEENQRASYENERAVFTAQMEYRKMLETRDKEEDEEDLRES